MSITKVPASRLIDHNIGSYCFRNKLINGDMRIDQRSAGNTFTHTAGTTTYGSCDRWIGYCTGSNITSQRVSGNSFGQPFPYAALRITGAANNTAAQIIQRIEAINVYDLAGQSVTLSFRVVSSTTITGYAVITTAGGVDNWSSGTQVGSTGFTTTTTPSTVTYTFTMPSSVTNGVQITIGASPLLAGQTIDITNVQLEVGPTATPFEYRPIGTELALCQRYYFSQFIAGIASRTSGELNGTVTMPFNFPVPMRTTPTVVNAVLNSGWIDGDIGAYVFPASTWVNGVRNDSNVYALSRTSNTQAYAQMGAPSGIGTSHGWPYRVAAILRADAEL